MLRKFFAFSVIAMAMMFVCVQDSHAAASEQTKAAKATTEQAKEFASSIGTQVLEVMQDKSTSKEKKMSTLEALFVDVVDVKWVGKFVLGKHWRASDEAQRTSYLDAYSIFLIKHYTSRFADYSGQTFTIDFSREERKGEFLVRMEIQHEGGKPVIVDYRVRAQADSTDTKPSFKVFDIIVEGVSLIATQRSEFDSVVNREGVDGLVKKLKAKTEKLTEQMK